MLVRSPSGQPIFGPNSYQRVGRLPFAAEPAGNGRSSLMTATMRNAWYRTRLRNPLFLFIIDYGLLLIEFAWNVMFVLLVVGLLA